MKPGLATTATFLRLAAHYLPVVLVLFVGLYAAQPLLDRRIAEGADTLLHLFRLTQVDALLDQGILFSRWSPDLAYGYGYPLFNYYAPLSYYGAELLHLAGLELTPHGLQRQGQLLHSHQPQKPRGIAGGRYARQQVRQPLEQDGVTPW